MITTPSNTPIPQPTPLTTPNGIWMQHFADRPTETDGPGKCSVPRVVTLDSDALIILITTRTSTVQTMTYSMQLDCFHFHTHHTVTSVYLKYTAANLKLFSDQN